MWHPSGDVRHFDSYPAELSELIFARKIPLHRPSEAYENSKTVIEELRWND